MMTISHLAEDIPNMDEKIFDLDDIDNIEDVSDSDMPPLVEDS